MDDSQESELVFVVPSSIDNSGTSETLEDPLGLSADAKSTGITDSSSFSCLQLSGGTQEYDSESLRIDEPQDNIIPSSPDVMHIDLSATPSLKHGSGDSKSLLKPTDEVHLNNDKDSGRMSPDMMVSGDISHRNNKMLDDKNCKSTLSNDDKSNFTDHDSEKIKSDKTGRENLSGPDFNKDKSKLNESNGSDPYNAETQPYSEPEAASDCKNVASYSMSDYLPQSTDKDSSSAPIFVTASSQGDSEKPGSFHSVPASIIPATAKDNLITSTNGDTSSQKEDKGDLQINHGTDVQSQEFSQDDLNLHLTLESQMSVGLSLPPGGDEDEILPPGGEEDVILDDQAQNDDKNVAVDIENSTSNETGDRATSNKEDICNAHMSNIPQTGESASHSPINQNESGFSMECSRATTFDSEDNVEIQKSKTNSDITKDTNLKEDCPEPVSQPEDKNSAADDLCSGHIADDCAVTKEKPPIRPFVQDKNMVQANVVQQLMIYDENSNSNNTNFDTTKKLHEGNGEGAKGSVSQKQSSNANVTSKDETGEINPSMQSTYVNETANSMIMDVPQSQDTWADSGSTSKGMSDSPYMDSSDFSMEYSMQDRGHIGDLETQPFTATSKSGLNKPQDDQCQTTTITTEPGKEDYSCDVTGIVKDTVIIIVDSVIENKEKGTDNSCNNNKTLSNFANPSSPKHKVKQPLATNSTHGGKPMESQDIFEGRQNVEQDKSSDTLPVDENSDHELDTKETPKNEAAYVYRVTRSEVVETIFKGVVLETKVLPRKVKYLKRYPAKALAQTSVGSGYLADTSSLSRSSSNSSAKTNLNDSPAFGVPERSSSLELLPRNALATSMNSSSDSSQNSLTQNHSHTQTHTKSKGPSLPSSPRRRSDVKTSSPIVLLTPLSTQQLAAHDVSVTENVDTPPLTKIKPPISGSTPVDFGRKSDASSDVTDSNSPEFGYGEPMVATPAMLLESCQPSTSAAQKVSKQSEYTATYDCQPSTSAVQKISKPSEVAATDGIPVIARPPREEFFYHGTMLRQDQISGKCMVVFDDTKMVIEIRENDVLLITKLDKGQEVFVHQEGSPAGCYEAGGTIISPFPDNEESVPVGYFVEVESDSPKAPKKTKKFLIKDIIIEGKSLTRDQKRSFPQPINLVVSSSDVSLDNIVDGKRKSRRCTRSLGIVKSTSSPILTKTQRSLRKRRHEADPSTQGGDVKKTKLAYKNIEGSGSEPLFRNLCFILTSQTRQCRIYESDSEGSYADTDYIREEVEAMIKAGSGKVVKDFSKLMNSKCEKAFLISDSYCREMNYYLALAAGIECVSYRWILDSVNAAELLATEDYVLLAGYSLKQSKAVERLKVPRWPLHGLKVFLILNDNELWKPLLTSAGCKVVTYGDRDTNDSPRRCDVIVADVSTKYVARKCAKNSRTAVVSEEWVIQCLINNEKLPFNGHVLYSL